MLNFDTSKPWGEAHRYDFVVSPGAQFWRVQVKAADKLIDYRYRVKDSGADGEPYGLDEIDFVAAYLVPLDVWYIVPIEACLGLGYLCFYPSRSRGKYEKYREAWCLLACDRKARGRNDIPAQCRCRELPTRCAVCPNK